MIFGVCCQTILNYLVYEAVDIGKGSNAIVSMSHHFFEVHSAQDVHLHRVVGSNFRPIWPI